MIDKRSVLGVPTSITVQPTNNEYGLGLTDLESYTAGLTTGTQVLLEQNLIRPLQQEVERKFHANLARNAIQGNARDSITGLESRSLSALGYNEHGSLVTSWDKFGEADGLGPFWGNRIRTGKKTCVPAPGADCSGVTHKWTFEHHGDLRGANFARAKLHGANLRGVNLKKANLQSVVLRQADLRGAKLTKADFGPAIRRTRSELTPTCAAKDQCEGADLSGADLTDANLDYSNLRKANLTGANLTGANLYAANLWQADITGANMTGVYFCQTTMPNGKQDDSSC